MDQNQTINQPVDQSVDNDLQKAIDDITNTTNVDPVFSDPVAAPSSVPEGDTGELGEPVGPFPEPKVEMVAPAPEPIAPLESMNIPELNSDNLTPPMPEQTPEHSPEQSPEPIATPEPVVAPEPHIEEPTPIPTPSSSETLSMHQVKEAALRDLIPLLDHINMSPSQKFNIYRNIFEELKDYTVLDPAYKAAKEIPNDTDRAEALLYLVESIDKM